MIETKYNPVDIKLCQNYFSILVNKIYKVLPLKEEHSPTVCKYIESLLNEMTGSSKVISAIRNDGQYMAIIGTLEGLCKCDDVIVCKREVFKCIRTVEELNLKYFGGE